ncbi:MAG: vitamin K epoxide reductase family protein [Acidimicrobiia bacterium]|nr:vitamin K epoxide reductase family protein [Acidimicrobiia bacterium]
MPVARWVAPVTTAMAMAATAVAVYLTIAHYADPDLLVCSEGGTVDCSSVTSSDQSLLFGIPVALLGLIWAAGVSVLCLPMAWRAASRRVHQARLVAVIGGMAFVLWLIYAELIIVGAICLWCTVVHVLAFGLFVVVVMNASDVFSDA